MIWPWLYVMGFLVYEWDTLFSTPVSLGPILGTTAFILFGCVCAYLLGYIFARLVGLLLPRSRSIVWEAYLAEVSVPDKGIYLAKVLDDESEGVYIFSEVTTDDSVRRHHIDAILYDVIIRQIRKGRPNLMFERMVFTKPYLHYFAIEGGDTLYRTFFLPEGAYRDYTRAGAQK